MTRLRTYEADDGDRVISVVKGSHTCTEILHEKENLEKEIKNILKCYNVTKFSISIAVDKKVKDVECKITDIPELIKYL